MSNELPPLPRAAHGELYSRSQMHIYGLARERAAYERAARLCKQRWKGGYPQEVVDDLAAAIRKLGANK